MTRPGRKAALPRVTLFKLIVGTRSRRDWRCATANPTVAPGPSNIYVTSTADGVDLTWDAVEGYNVDFYGVLYWDTSIAGSFVSEYGFTGTSASLTGLPSGDSYVLAVQPWEIINGVEWAGLPAAASGAIIGGDPLPPANFKVVTINEGATVQMTWDAMADAAQYRVWTRSLLNASSVLSPGEFTTSETCYGGTYLFPGAWNFEFCVTAMNGNYETSLSGCQVAPTVITTVSACPSPTVTAAGSGATPTVTWSTPSTSTPAPYQSYTWPANHNFVGFGDSYAAGVGAGSWVADYWDPYDTCLRGANACPYQVANALDPVPAMYHLACSGAVVQDLAGTSSQRDENQIQLVTPYLNNIGWATLSMGGNDAGFGEIASNCLLWAV